MTSDERRVASDERREHEMQFTRKSFSNLAALESGEDSMAELQGTSVGVGGGGARAGRQSGRLHTLMK